MSNGSTKNVNRSSFEIEDETVSTELTESLNAALHTEFAPEMHINVHVRSDGQSITLDCATGVRLSEAPNDAEVAAVLLQLCASLDDINLRIGLLGEYDEVHLYTTLLTAELQAADLAGTAQAINSRAMGVRQLILADPSGDASNGGTEY